VKGLSPQGSSAGVVYYWIGSNGFAWRIGDDERNRFLGRCHLAGCIFLMIPSALTLGIGIQCLTLSVTGIYSLIAGKPVYGFTVVVDFRRNCPDSK